MNDTAVRDAAARMLGAGPDALEWQALAGGANNRVYRVTTGTGTRVVKSYFVHEGDQRDRLASEYRFMRFAWSHGIRSIPEPIAVDWTARVAIYEDVRGIRVAAGHIDDSHIDQAIEFVQAINAPRLEASGTELPPASEAQFTIDGHLANVAARVDRLRRAETSDAIDHEAARFIEHDLTEAWVHVHQQARRRAALEGTSLSRVLPANERRLSPSDFGFHNAILESSGRVRFIDFEYAGWDDPAKLVCDFFCQEAVPIPERYFEAFATAVTRGVPRSDEVRARIDLLMPVYRIKWCCIILNEFLPIAAERRRFLSATDTAARKSAQLHKARQAISQQAHS